MPKVFSAVADVRMQTAMPIAVVADSYEEAIARVKQYIEANRPHGFIVLNVDNVTVTPVAPIPEE